MFNDIYDIAVVLVKDRRIIAWTTVGFIIFALIISLILPNMYRATATLMPPVSQGTSLMSLVTRTNVMSDPELGGTGFMPGMVTPSDIFAYMLKSGAVTEIVIRECDLVSHYREGKTFAKQQNKALYNVGKKLEKATKIKVTDERFITITVEDKDKNKAAEIANKYGEALDRVYGRMTMTQGGKMREFIEKRVVQEEKLLHQTEDSLQQFQQRYKTISLGDEMKAVIEMSATLEAKIISQKIEMDAIKSYATDDNTQVKVMENQIEKSQQELNNLVNGSRGKTLFVSFAKAPAIAIIFGQLTRAVRIHQELYTLLMQQMEQAKILEAKDTPKVQFLERAAPPYRKSWPRRSLIVIACFFVGMIFGSSIVIIRHYYSYLVSDPSRAEKISALIDPIARDLRSMRITK